METIPSFVPLAARLAAHAAALRPVDGARDDWAKVAALVICALLDMLVCVCAALDASAAAGIRPVAAAPRDNKVASVPAPRAERQALPSESLTRLLRLAPKVYVIPSEQADDAPFRLAEATSAAPWLAWSGDLGPLRAVSALPWRPYRKTPYFHLRPCTPILLHFRNVHLIARVVFGWMLDRYLPPTPSPRRNSPPALDGAWSFPG